MGKVTGFKEYTRELPTRRPVAERINDYLEVYQPFPEENVRIQGARCMDCGISHPAVLQFHHRDRADKSFTIANVASRATSVKQITNEMKKCDVVCVNCHAKRHWRETHETDSWEEVLPPEE